MAEFDDQQLLELIEEPNDATARERLATLQARDPKLASAVEAMRRDREVLCGLPAIDPPVDFLAELEPQIARPMLMDDVPTVATEPGAARRAAHRRRMRGQLLQAAVAAAVALVVFVGAWISASSMGLFDRSETLAANSIGDANSEQVNATNANDGGGAVDVVASADELDGELHHRLPTLETIAQLTRSTNAESSAATDAQPNPAGEAARQTFVLAEFALVLQDDDAANAERALQSAVASIASESAVVKNLTVDELKLIEQAWLARRAEQGRPAEPMRASVGGDHTRTSGNRSGPRPVRLNVEMLQESVEQLIDAGLVAGSADLMPDYSRQLELSAGGMRYTIAVPVGELRDVLHRLHSRTGGSEALVMRDSLSQSSTFTAAQWAKGLGEIRASLDRLQREQPNAVLLVPVVIGGE